MTYGEMLRDPRWQRKRLEIFQRDGFQCQFCGDADSPLHVHHIHYLKGSAPWEYPEEFLVTLCEDCHEEEKDELHQSKAWLMFMLCKMGIRSAEQIWNFGDQLKRRYEEQQKCKDQTT